MGLDRSLVGVPSEPQLRSWDSKDALLYAVGVGAGLGSPLEELEFTTENCEGIEQQVLPTFGVLIAQARAGRSLGDFNRAMLVHAEQFFELHRPLPVTGTARTVSTVTGIYDKGSGALVVSENVAVDAATGEPLVTARSGTFIRGEGGFGGPRGAGLPWERPDREPDQQVVLRTRPEQALIYRLSGDRNPLHVDPELRGQGRLQPADPARPVHLRSHRPGSAARAVRLGSRQVPVDVRPLQPSGAAGRVADRVDVAATRQRHRALPDDAGGRRGRDRQGPVPGWLKRALTAATLRSE